MIVIWLPANADLKMKDGKQEGSSGSCQISQSPYPYRYGALCINIGA